MTLFHSYENDFDLKENETVGATHFHMNGLPLRLHSDLVPEHGARERYLMGTNVNTPFFQVPKPEFGHSACARVQTWALNWAMIYRVPSV